MQHLASEDDASANIKGRRSGTRSNEMDIDSENEVNGVQASPQKGRTERSGGDQDAFLLKGRNFERYQEQGATTREEGEDKNGQRRHKMLANIFPPSRWTR
jgi:hypothetical protein